MIFNPGTQERFACTLPPGLCYLSLFSLCFFLWGHRLPKSLLEFRLFGSFPCLMISSFSDTQRVHILWPGEYTGHTFRIFQETFFWSIFLSQRYLERVVFDFLYSWFKEWVQANLSCVPGLKIIRYLYKADQLTHHDAVEQSEYYIPHLRETMVLPSVYK